MGKLRAQSGVSCLHLEFGEGGGTALGPVEEDS